MGVGLCQASQGQFVRNVAIVAAVEGGMQQRDVAAAYGISAARVSQIVDKHRKAQRQGFASQGDRVAQLAEQERRIRIEPKVVYVGEQQDVTTFERVIERKLVEVESDMPGFKKFEIVRNADA